MGRRSKGACQPAEQITVSIESIDLEGRGVGHHDGKVVFVHGALAGETVLAEITRKKPSFNKAKTLEVLRESPNRVSKPRCPNYGVCGGCSMQHIHPMAQVAVKSRALEDLLERIGRHKPETILPPLFGPDWHYRHRARLSARYVYKKQKMLVGFREKGAAYVTDMTECHVLPKAVSDLIPKLSAFLPSLSHFERMPQLELAVGDDQIALVLRHMEPLSEADHQKLRDFGILHQVDWWLQPKGPETVHRLNTEAGQYLTYSMPSFGVTMQFMPTDFTQVNHMINDAMVHRAVQLLQLGPDDQVLDLFCGLGNFSLPLATQCASVKGFEGSADLVARAAENAVFNGLGDRTSFHERNLFDVTAPEWESWGQYSKVLIDPPRDGAVAVCEAIARTDDARQPERIVYVSCNPATLARDVNVLCESGAYRLAKAGVINMFPHTGHVESIALLIKSMS